MRPEIASTRREAKISVCARLSAAYPDAIGFRTSLSPWQGRLPSGGQGCRVEPGRPGQLAFVAKPQAQLDGFEAGATRQKVLQHIDVKGVGTLHEFSCLLRRLTDSDLAEKLQERTLKRGDLWRASTALKG